MLRRARSYWINDTKMFDITYKLDGWVIVSQFLTSPLGNSGLNREAKVKKEKFNVSYTLLAVQGAIALLSETSEPFCCISSFCFEENW